MVVARKTPVAPNPSSSRSSSSQQPAKSAPPKTQPLPVPSSNGKVQSAPKKSKSKSESIKPPKAKKSSYSALYILVLFIFTVYTVAVCPSNYPRTSPVCSSLDLYRAHILDPYILPPVQTLVHHAEPYIAPVKPYASTAAQFTRTHVVPRVSALVQLTLDQYNTQVAPRLYWVFVDQYWNGFIKPTYYKGLHNILEQYTRPYRIYYYQFIVPNANKAFAHANDTYVRVKPHAEHYLSEARRHTINAYQTARPHVIEAYRRALPHAVFAYEKAKFYGIVLSSKVGDARRQFVDPHILRIWEKVSEVTPSSTPSSYSQTWTSTPAPTQASEDAPTRSSSSVVETAATQTPEHVVPTESVADPEPEQEPEPEATVPPQEETPVPTQSLTPDTPEPSSSSLVEAEISLSSAPVHATPVPVVEHEANSAASVVAASLHVAAAAAEIPVESATTEAEPVSTPHFELKDSDESTSEMDDFLKDLGISLDGEVVEENVVAQEEAVEEEQSAEAQNPTYGDPVPSPEEKLEMTAKKRAAILSRHEKWQAELDTLVRDKMHSIRAFLTESRIAAVAELAQWGPDKKGVIAEVDSEGTKLLKGLEGYLKGVEEKVNKLRKSGKEYTKEQRGNDLEMLNKVVEKVELRMSVKVNDVQKEVHEWFVAVLQRETQEIDAVSEKVKALADRAQGDLGLDYAWLDDVTYYDWQKYHDLMRTSENFTTQAQRIQSQVEPEGSNEVVDALNELEQEVNDVVEGFNIFIASIRRRAESDDGIFGHDDSASKVEEAEEEEPEVSILPIEPIDEKVAPVPVEDVFVGRSKEEVEAKLADVPVENVRAGREEL